VTTGVGDIATVTLTVAEGDVGTAAAFAVVAPDGTESSPAVTGGPTAWVAQVPLTDAGRWTGLWTVTGAGEGTEPWELRVAPNPPGSRRTYATTTDLADYLGTAPPAGADLLLARATRDVDRALLCAVYDPEDADVIAALKEATCEQVAGNVAAGATDGIGAGPTRSFTLGKLSVNKAGGAPSNPSAQAVKVGPLWEQAWNILQQAGLTGDGPGEPVGWGW
jgi:hypothetical protein